MAGIMGGGHLNATKAKSIFYLPRSKKSKYTGMQLTDIQEIWNYSEIVYKHSRNVSKKISERYLIQNQSYKQMKLVETDIRRNQQREERSLS